MKQTTILWTGREYYSLEHCLVKTTAAGREINSTIIGYYEGNIYKAEYRVETNSNWEVISADITGTYADQTVLVRLENNGGADWLLDGKEDERFRGCVDVDIPLTPFTNSLPINRLRLEENKEQVIKVIYIDILSQKISVVQQKYIRLSSGIYHYENIPNDFEADIEVDGSGFVVDYPALFVRTAIVEG